MFDSINLLIHIDEERLLTARNGNLSVDVCHAKRLFLSKPYTFLENKINNAYIESIHVEMFYK